VTDVDRDVVDAALVADVAIALRRWEAAIGRQAVLRPLREAIWFVWERPRLPKPLVRGKYPEQVHWSAHARQLHLHGDSRRELVIEHAAPMRLLMRRLIDDTELTTHRCLEQLRAGGKWLVITREENTLLSAAGVADRMPDSVRFDPEDPWARHRHAGLDVDAFAPLHGHR
jgi:hypothetical protein